MDNSYTKITKSKSLTPLYLIFSLALTGLSVFCFILPFIKNIESPLNYAFMIFGGVGSLFFAFAFFNCLYQLFKPKNAFILSDEGFLDLTNGGEGAGFIPWSNVAGVEMCGSSKKPYIGIRLIDANEVLKTAKRPLEKQINTLLESGKPELVIRPFEISISLHSAFDIFVERRNAYLRTVDHGDTNVLFGDFTIAPKRQPKPVDEEVKEVNEIKETKPNMEKTSEIPRLLKSESEEKSVDELLAELAKSIGKSRDKLEGGKDEKNDDAVLTAELERFLKKLKNENKDSK